MKRAKKWCKRILLGTAIFLGLNAATIPVTYLVNKNINAEKNTIVFTSGKNNLEQYGIPNIPSPLMAKIIDFFMYTPVTLRETLKGNKVYWCSNPSLERFVDEVENPKYHNITLFGHGSKNSYALFDGNAYAYNFRMISVPYRDGEFCQYTCGEEGEDGENLKDVLFTNCKRSKTFDGILDPFTSYASAWKDVFYSGE